MTTSTFLRRVSVFALAVALMASAVILTLIIGRAVNAQSNPAGQTWIHNMESTPMTCELICSSKGSKLLINGCYAKDAKNNPKLCTVSSATKCIDYNSSKLITIDYSTACCCEGTDFKRCTSTDGDNPFVKGTTNNGQGTIVTDSCNGNEIVDYKCNALGNVQNIGGYVCPNGCKDGACVAAPISNCTDSDGTPDYYGLGPEQVSKINDSSKNTKGTISAPTPNGIQRNEMDVCEASNKVREHFCDRGKYFGYIILDCSNGCQDGACVAEPKPECTDSENMNICMPVSVANPQGHLLMKRSCNNSKIKDEYFNCPNGCEDGACLEEPKSVECEGEDCPEEPKAKQKFTVYAGVEVYYKNSAFEVTGEASDLGTKLSDSLDMRWSQVSGPSGGKVVFSKTKCLVPSFAAYCQTSISATKDGVYKIRLKVTNPKKISSYDDIALVWDTTAPVLKEVKKIPIIGNDPNPTVTFSSTAINAVKPVYNRFGYIIYDGACAGHDVSAKDGNNAIELIKLADGAYDDCTIQVQDMAGNFSNVLKISKFTIDTQPPDPPIMNEPEDDITDSSYTISGTKEAGTSVWLGNKQIVKHNADTSWKYKVKLNSGENKFSIFTKDEADNNSQKVVLNVEKQKPICTAWAYGAWGKCDDNQQTRKILSASPGKCAGGKPVVSKDCKAEKNKPLCESYNYSAWSKCVNNKQARTIESTLPDNCRGGESPVLNQECGPYACDFANYTAWSSCDATTGKKTRQIESMAPEGCVIKNPVLSADCNGCESYNYSTWSVCLNNKQTRNVESTLPVDCHGGVQPVLSQVCGKSTCDFVYYTTWSACDKTTGKRTRQIESTVPKICVPKNPELTKSCDACESYNYSIWSVCVNNKQTRNVESTLPTSCSGGIEPLLSRECGKNYCDFVYYTTWSACNKTTGKRTRQIESTVPKLCVVENPELEKDCNACESYNYSMWSACVNNKQTRTIESTFPSDCSGGVQPITSRECGKSACDFTYYTAWSACDKSTGQRTRQVESTVPAVCVVENPWLTKDCNACESYNYSVWSACVNNTQTRTIESTFPSDCSGGAQPLLSRECGKEFCDFVYYTTWSKCDKSTGLRTRQIESTVPTVCVPENPWLTKDCEPCESYNYSAWSACDGSGIQHRTLETDPTVAPTFPADCYGGAQPVYTRTCPLCDSWIFSAWSACTNGQQTRTITPGTSLPLNCWGGSPELSRSCN